MITSMSLKLILMMIRSGFEDKSFIVRSGKRNEKDDGEI